MIITASFQKISWRPCEDLLFNLLLLVQTVTSSLQTDSGNATTYEQGGLKICTHLVWEHPALLDSLSILYSRSILKKKLHFFPFQVFIFPTIRAFSSSLSLWKISLCLDIWEHDLRDREIGRTFLTRIKKNLAKGPTHTITKTSPFQLWLRTVN